MTQARKEQQNFLSVLTDGTGFSIGYQSAATTTPGAISLTGQTGGAGNPGGGTSIIAGSGGSASSGGTATFAGGSGTDGGSGGNARLRGGAGGSTGTGGTALVAGGSGGSSSGNGGEARISGGTPTDGDGGAITLDAAAGVGTNRSGGAVTVTSGSSTGSAIGGAISMTAGQGGTSAKGGNITLTGGLSGSSSGDGGNIDLRSGEGITNHGDIILRLGDTTLGTFTGVFVNLGTFTYGAGVTPKLIQAATGSGAHDFTITAQEATAGAGAHLRLNGGQGSTTGGSTYIDAGTGATKGGIAIGSTNASSITLGNVTDNTPVTILGSGGLSMTTDGFVRMDERVSAPTTSANEGAVYVKDSGGLPQLFFRTESNGSEYQITPTFSSPLRYVAVAGRQGTDVVSPGYTNIGAMVLDPTEIDGYLDGYYLFQAVLETTSASLPAEVLLYNITDGVEVPSFVSTPLTTTSVVATLLQRVLSIGTDIPAKQVLYQVRVRFASGAPGASDQVTCNLAQVRIS